MLVEVLYSRSALCTNCTVKTLLCQASIKNPTSEEPGVAKSIYTPENADKKIGTEVPILLFWVTRHSCPGDHAARAKTSSLEALASICFA